MSRKAFKDLRKIITWYGFRSFGTVDQLMTAINNRVEAITVTPERYKVVIPGVKRCLMAAFPFVIYFAETKQGIVMLRVRHHRQKILKRYN